jgi:succinylglutamate desuccinylase
MNSPHLIDVFKKDLSEKVIVIGGMHGNEISGIEAIQHVISRLKDNPDWIKKGEIYFLKGNLSALKTGERFVDKDLNRLWQEKYINQEDYTLADIKDLQGLHTLIDKICRGDYSRCTLLDLHTFSAQSGIFCIPSQNQKSLDLASSFHIPFIEKLSSSLPGTALAYYGDKGMSSIVVEGGTHGSKRATENLEAAIWHLLAYKGIVSDDLEIVKNSRMKLQKEGEIYPYHLELTYRYQLDDSRFFSMKKGYYNFKKIKEKEVLAKHYDQEIESPHEGFMLMPLYQKKGSDGFFIVKEIKDIYTKTK